MNGIDNISTHRRVRLQLSSLTFILLVHTTLPSVVGLIQNGRTSGLSDSTGSVTLSNLSDDIKVITPWVVIVVAALIVHSNWRREHGPRNALLYILTGLSLIVIAWAAHTGQPSVPLPIVLIAVTAVGIWSIRPDLSDLVVFGRFGFVIAVISLTMALTTELAWMSGGEDSKALIGDRTLAGFFPQMNILGMSAAMALPFAGLFATRFRRVLGVLLLLTVLILASSRTSLIAVGGGIVSVVILLLVSRRARRGTFLILLVLITGAAAVVPLVANNDLVFTGRGVVWRVSVDLFRHSPTLGIGPNVYTPDGQVFARTQGVFWHGHNSLLTFATIFGLLGLIALFLLVLPAVRTAAVTASQSLVPVAAILTLLSLSVAESPLRPNEFDGPAWIVWTSLIAIGLIPINERREIFLASENSKSTATTRSQTSTAVS